MPGGLRARRTSRGVRDRDCARIRDPLPLLSARSRRSRSMLTSSPRLPHRDRRVLDRQSELEGDLDDAARTSSSPPGSPRSCRAMPRIPQSRMTFSNPISARQLDALARPTRSPASDLPAERVERRHAAVCEHEIRVLDRLRAALTASAPTSRARAVLPATPESAAQAAASRAPRARLLACSKELGIASSYAPSHSCEPTLWLQRVAELHQHRGALGVSAIRVERASVGSFGRGDVEAHRTIARQHGEAERSRPPSSPASSSSPAARRSSSACA